MNTDNIVLKEIRASILLDTKRFLIGLDSGASYDQLTGILVEIKEKELQLIKNGGSMLAPEMWRLLNSRLANRRAGDVFGQFNTPVDEMRKI